MAISGTYNGVFLDADSLNQNDLSFNDLKSTLPQWRFFKATAASQTIERIREANIIITNKVVIDANCLKSAKHLKLICVAATGTNNVDLKAAADLGIPVCNVTGYGTASVAQHTLMLMLALATNFPAYQADIRAGIWQQSPQFCLMHHPIIELRGKTLGIIGYGELGRAVSELAKAFGMKVLVSNRPGEVPMAERVSWQECISQADILSLHCLLSKKTQHLINQSVLKQMKPSALLINTARGGLIDESALLTALVSGDIAGAALDVLHEEPPVKGSCLLDASLPNLIISPHNAWASREARQRMVTELGKNIHAFINGQNRNLVSC